MSRARANLFLVIATVAWGLAFVAQKTAMDSVGPLTFVALRYLIGGIAILPLVFWENKRVSQTLTKRHKIMMLFVAINLLAGSLLQQYGLLSTNVTNAGFLTGLYVFFVPLIMMIGFKMKPHPVVWIAAPIALFGLFLLGGGAISNFVFGDYLIAASALFWAGHVLMLGMLAASTKRPILISAVTFLIGGFIAAVATPFFETVTLQGLFDARWEILYAGLISTALGFTLQAIGQEHTPPANAAIILNAESLFAAFAGAVFLGERLPFVGYIGCAVLLVAIITVELVPALQNRRRQSASG